MEWLRENVQDIYPAFGPIKKGKAKKQVIIFLLFYNKTNIKIYKRRKEKKKREDVREKRQKERRREKMMSTYFRFTIDINDFSEDRYIYF